MATIVEDLQEQLVNARDLVVRLEAQVASIPFELVSLEASVVHAVKSWLGLGA